ncbi:LysR family transcriptional regulator [Pelagibacterium xiamenense]|uniref:LysR family transcriptional regulator n=1 Tax=Pelagibacterium xiamenense TaxID=2901140 RepID=UPI001E312B54|nr:LysR family transcriptional regulator [Pelagibacterium xiamenense]MCD7058621.1 LysR family transcriptional regulator [Pelagibacterium xiamenense]
MAQFAEIPNLRHLRMLQVIGKTGGVSCASRELSTSQPAVTQAVANLEAEIGCPIFERCATGTYPTVLGRRYLLRIDRFFDILDTALAQALPPGNQRQGRGSPRADWLITNTQLRSLIVTCEQGRVNEFATAIGLSPASLFRSARTLERALGRPLFERTARGLLPTKLGETLAREFRRAVREIEMANGEVLLANGNESLEITVGALPMAGSHDLARATRDFLALYPSAKVRLVTGEYHKLVADLSSSRIDMIYGILRKPEWAEDLSEELLFYDSYCLVVRAGHPLTRVKEVTPADLVDCDWVVPQLNTPRRNRIEKIFDALGRKPRFPLETPSLAVIRAFLLDFDTITLMTRSEVQGDLDRGILVSLPTRFLGTKLRKGLTTRSDWLPTEAHEAFLNCLRSVASELDYDRAVKPEMMLVS